MAEHVCPWWIGYLLVSPIRRWMQNPEKFLTPYVHPGMTVLEPGPGMGFFTLPLAKLVGSGRVIAVDVQSKMLDALRRRAAKAGLLQRIESRLAQSDSMGIDDLAGKVDLVLAFAVVHEFPSADAFFRQTALALKPDGQMLFAEPDGHVKADLFGRELESASQAGLEVVQTLRVKRSHAVLLRRPPV
jgi:ubiquinone/menaquinone biosynthesis C-methylase UbiE